MPDYSNSVTQASSRHHSNHTESSNALPENTDSQFDELIAGYSPQNEVMATHFPANNRVSSLATSPTKLLRPSAAAEARTASYSHMHARSVSVSTRDPQQPRPQARESSDVSMKSCFSNQLSDHPVKAKPAAEIKSRKEGRSSEDTVPVKHQQKKLSAMRPVKIEEKAEGKSGVVNDGKRKRTVTLPGPNVPIENLLSSSPTRKVSRIEGEKLGLDGEAGGRNVLGDLENVM